jgi:hypothetical protein
MLSSFYLSGRLGEVISREMRYIEVDRVVPNDCGRFVVDRFPVRAMTGPSGHFMKSPKGALINCKGRLECDEKEGLYLVDEMDEIFLLPPEMKKTSSLGE